MWTKLKSNFFVEIHIFVGTLQFSDFDLSLENHEASTVYEKNKVILRHRYVIGTVLEIVNKFFNVFSSLQIFMFENEKCVYRDQKFFLDRCQNWYEKSQKSVQISYRKRKT